MQLNILLFLIALIIYFISPLSYDATIIWIDFALFIIGSCFLLREKKERFNILSFNVIFLFSFFFCTYSYALFVIYAGVEFSMTIFGFTDFDYITKTVSLGTVAITVYFCSYSYQKIKKPTTLGIKEFTNTKKIKLIGLIRSFFFICVLLNFFYFIYIRGGNSFSITSAAFIPEFYKVFLIIYLLLSRLCYKKKEINLYSILLHNKRALIEALIICLLYLIGGDRGLPISIVFIFLGIYGLFYIRLKIIHFIIIVFVGVVVLFALRVTRGSENSLSEGGFMAVTETTQKFLSDASPILLFSDLMGTSVEMCLGYEYVQRYGFVYPNKIFLLPLYPIPFLPSIVGILIYDKVPYEMSTAYILNDYVGRTFDYRSSLGNHIVLDIYISWGIIGVIVFFIIFGRSIAYIERNKSSNLFLAGSYILLISLALYLPRDSMFNILRPIALMYFINLIFNLTYKLKKYH